MGNGHFSGDALDGIHPALQIETIFDHGFQPFGRPGQLEGQADIPEEFSGVPDLSAKVVIFKPQHAVKHVRGARVLFLADLVEQVVFAPDFKEQGVEGVVDDIREFTLDALVFVGLINEILGVKGGQRRGCPVQPQKGRRDLIGLRILAQGPDLCNIRTGKPQGKLRADSDLAVQDLLFCLFPSGFLRGSGQFMEQKPQGLDKGKGAALL